jgi:hypothetical protein
VIRASKSSSAANGVLLLVVQIEQCFHALTFVTIQNHSTFYGLALSQGIAAKVGLLKVSSTVLAPFWSVDFFVIGSGEGEHITLDEACSCQVVSLCGFYCSPKELCKKSSKRFR